ncbi:MAG: serine hydrolase [Bacteroidetes bacterium]|nr:serine hydrolase [Bacteroidota bacterium]HET6243381.1 glycoside hydrolase family 3 N-terminal domain-containing protein [Bacteroidia bacterium]
MRLSIHLLFAGLLLLVSNFVPFAPLSFSLAYGQQPPNYLQNPHWADSVFKKLTPDERIAQLFMVAAYSNKDQKHVEEIVDLVNKYKIGGLIFFQGGPLRQAHLTNYYQSLAKVPLMISIDGEWGLAMRLDSTVQFPKQMTLGAIQNDSLIYQMGAEIANHCKRIGIHVNLAPVVDVNNNPANPVIGNRAFGENKYNVARKGIAYMKGMQDNGVMANAKHFPGHGDTDSDSHKTLPLISHSRQRMDSIELYPFKELIDNGLGSMMVAHLYIPAYDATKDIATTLSKVVVTDLLQNQYGFKGLIFTDALNMKGVSKFFPPGIVDVKALLAGNDVLLFAEDVPTAIFEIKKSIERGEITQSEIDLKCMKILMAKQWCGLNKYQPVQIKKLYEDLNSVSSELINRKLTEASLTVLNNKNNLLPLMNLDTLKIASLLIGSNQANAFQQTLELYTQVDHYFIDKEATIDKINSKLDQLNDYNLVIISVTGTNNNRNKNYGINNVTIDLINRLSNRVKTIVHLPANPYSLTKIEGIEKVDALIMAYEDNEWSKNYSAQLIFGGIAATGKLPVTASKLYVEGMGHNTIKTRFKYTIPEEMFIKSKQFNKIDSIAYYGISQNAYPGCQILVAKSGNVIYNKSFGYHTYENKIKVKNSDIYDLASITKIAASVPGIMKLQDENLITLDDKLCDFLPSVDSCNKNSASLRNILTHQAGFRDWIPFYLKTINKGVYKPGVYNKEKSEEFPFRVAENLYIHKDYPDSIMSRVINSPVAEKVEYKYSDLGYYLVKEIIERYTYMPLEIFSQKTFYGPLGMTTTTYRPRERFPLNRIVPTEYDLAFRKQLIHGDVHDQGAAMLGGVAGHAGLFSNANDLAKLMQMYMQFGEYGGIRYFRKEIIQEYIKCQFCENENRRGIGFDKPEMNYNKIGPTCKCVSDMSFGHTGFTGTMAWADPENELIFIFLSNRVYPDAENKKLVSLGIRTQIQNAIHEALKINN